MNFDELSSFIVFAEHLNFTRAAEELLISQPALHFKIQKLSQTVGEPLYVKTGRALSLTRRGVEFLSFAREMTSAQKRFLDGGTTQTVSLAAGEGSYLYLLGEAVLKFRGSSDAELKLLTANREQAYHYLRTGFALLAVTVTNAIPKEFSGSLIKEVRSQLVLPQAHHLARKDELALSDLEGLELIVPPRGRPFRETLDLILSQNRVDWRVGMEASGWELMMHFVRLGMGVTIVNGCCRVPAECTAVPIRGLPTARYNLLQLKERTLSSEAQFLRECLLEVGETGEDEGLHLATML